MPSETPPCKRDKSGEIETVEVHDRVPRRDKVVHEFLLGVLASADFRPPRTGCSPTAGSDRVS